MRAADSCPLPRAMAAHGTLLSHPAPRMATLVPTSHRAVPTPPTGGRVDRTLVMEAVVLGPSSRPSVPFVAHGRTLQRPARLPPGRAAFVAAHGARPDTGAAGLPRRGHRHP